MSLWNTLRHIYWDSTRPTRLTTVILYPLAAFGLARAYAKYTSDVDWMFHLLPGIPDYCQALLWGVLIAYVWVARIVGVLYNHPGYKWTLRTTPFFGCAFWLALLVSNLVDIEHLAFGLLYGVAALMEMWILSRNWQETQ